MYFIPTDTDLRRFRGYSKQFLSLVSIYKNRFEDIWKFRNNIPFDNPSANIVDESFYSNLKNTISRSIAIEKDIRNL